MIETAESEQFKDTMQAGKDFVSGTAGMIGDGFKYGYDKLMEVPEFKKWQINSMKALISFVTPKDSRTWQLLPKRALLNSIMLYSKESTISLLLILKKMNCRQLQIKPTKTTSKSLII